MSESMWDYFEIYPHDPRSGFEVIDYPMWHPLYKIEFTRSKKEEPMHWRLFKKNFIITREEWNKMLKEDPEKLHRDTMMGIEGHPYQLANGTVNEHPGVIAMDTMEFLKYMVDALNEKARTNDMLLDVIEKAKESDKPLTDGDLTHKMVPMPIAGGGTILVYETELPDYPRDGQSA